MTGKRRSKSSRVRSSASSSRRAGGRSPGARSAVGAKTFPEAAHHEPGLSRRFASYILAVVLVLAVSAAVALLAVWLWQRVRPSVARSDVYLLDARDIEITPEPRWIRANVKAEVLRDANLEGNLSLLDEDLARRVREAFEFHPWVQSARATKIYPARIRVEIVYRKPVAMVQVEHANRVGLVPLDALGVRLPAEDLSPLEKRRYPRLVRCGALPLVGQQATDGRIVAGARLAETLLEAWEEMKLEKIVLPEPATMPPVTVEDDPSQRVYLIVARNGMQIVWGAPPGEEPQGEATAAEKLATLRHYLRQHEGADAEGPLDLRNVTRHDAAAAAP